MKQINPYRKGLHLLKMAEGIESDAKANLQAWIILDQAEKYFHAMNKASILRRAENIRTLSERRNFLNSHNIYL